MATQFVAGGVDGSLCCRQDRRGRAGRGIGAPRICAKSSGVGLHGGRKRSSGPSAAAGSEPPPPAERPLDTGLPI